MNRLESWVCPNVCKQELDCVEPPIHDEQTIFPTDWTLIYRFDAKILMRKIKILGKITTISVSLPVLKSSLLKWLK